MLALRSGREDLAKEALLRKQEIDGSPCSTASSGKRSAPRWRGSKASLRGLQEKIEEAQRKKNLLIARAKRAEAQKQIQSTMSSMSDTSAFEAFDRMAAKVDQIEAEADAFRELEADTREDSLEKKLAALESSEPTADRLLEELKAKMARLEDRTGGSTGEGGEPPAGG